ncbi:hypothetical protein RchiOBHm_Chr4g0434931 [Rosa chinensis]|uniref:Uncharacterized protein n=1 Tax=Rosa chinensis TaxID=74649 RepID=A0A2P6R1M8_ROSCH|nr:hypothetical protein RchiOBHm_Chr4g0434931 [Rosa chinensis]
MHAYINIERFLGGEPIPTHFFNQPLKIRHLCNFFPCWHLLGGLQNGSKISVKFYLSLLLNFSYYYCDRQIKATAIVHLYHYIVHL